MLGGTANRIADGRAAARDDRAARLGHAHAAAGLRPHPRLPVDGDVAALAAPARHIRRARARAQRVRGARRPGRGARAGYASSSSAPATSGRSSATSRTRPSGCAPSAHVQAPPPRRHRRGHRRPRDRARAERPRVQAARSAACSGRRNLAVLGVVGGGRRSSTKSSAAGRARPRRAAARLPEGGRAEDAHPRTRKQPTSTLDASKTWTATFETSCGSFTIRLDVKDSPHTTASFVSLARSRLLRRHDLPPHRARLRHPGRRPDGDRRAAGPATRSSTRRRARRRTRAGSSRWRRRPPSRRERPAASSSSSPATRRSCRPTTPCSARSSKGMAVAAKIGTLGERDRRGHADAGSSSSGSITISST